MPIIIEFGGIKSRVNPSNPCGSVPQCFTYQKNLSALTTSLIVAAIEDWHIFVASKLLCVIHKLSCMRSVLDRRRPCERSSCNTSKIPY